MIPVGFIKIVVYQPHLMKGEKLINVNHIVSIWQNPNRETELLLVTGNTICSDQCINDIVEQVNNALHTLMTRSVWVEK